MSSNTLTVHSTPLEPPRLHQYRIFLYGLDLDVRYHFHCYGCFLRPLCDHQELDESLLRLGRIRRPPPV
jgi:hypothetical protein